MLRFEMDVLTADLESRTVEGILVPYGEVGKIQGVDYRFAPGSVRFARARTPLLVDHDTAQPIGVLNEVVDGELGALGRFRIDRTPAGDMALAQAASGSRGSLSVGAEVEQATPDAAGVFDVAAAAIHEVSLLALGAFAGAQVTRVAAQADAPLPPELEPEPEPEPEPAEEPEPDPDQTELELDKPEEGQTMEATRTAPLMRAVKERPELRAGELVQLMIRAQHGDLEARRYIEAATALAEVASTDVTGLLPPTYERQVIGATVTPRPLHDLFSSRSLPGVGLAVTKPKWTTKPVGAWAATVDADATTGPAVIGTQTANVERWDYAVAMSWVVIQRSDPGVVDEIYGEAVQNFYRAIETRAAALLAAAATNAATSLGAAVAAFFGAVHRNPDVCVVAPDVWGKLADRGVLQQPVAGGPVAVNQFGLTAIWGGIPIVASPDLAATYAYIATRRALDIRVTDPVRLTANAIGALNVELAVVGEALFDTDYPAEILEFVPTIPAPTTAEASSGRSSK